MQSILLFNLQLGEVGRMDSCLFKVCQSFRIIYQLECFLPLIKLTTKPGERSRLYYLTYSLVEQHQWSHACHKFLSDDKHCVIHIFNEFNMQVNIQFLFYFEVTILQVLNICRYLNKYGEERTHAKPIVKSKFVLLEMHVN